MWRIFHERGFHTLKEMAYYLEENPKVFYRYISYNTKKKPSDEKLEKWAHILDIPVSEFFTIYPKEQWIISPGHKRKPGIGYRRAIQIREEIEELLSEEEIKAHEGLDFLCHDFYPESHKDERYVAPEEDKGDE